jgi:hypothetical protein
MAVAQVIPTPNALNNNLLSPISWSCNSLTIVSGTDTEDVLPNLAIVEGILDVSNFSFLAKYELIKLFA